MQLRVRVTLSVFSDYHGQEKYTIVSTTPGFARQRGDKPPGCLSKGVPEIRVSQVIIARHSERSEESRPGQAVWVLWREILRFTAFRY